MDIFIARQGIYDREEKVVAYELLYRNSTINSFNSNVEDELATYQLIENINAFGIDKLTNNKIGFVNFPEQLINKNIATLLPKDKVVIEILENVKPTEEVMKNLKKLKKQGYSLALDDVEREEDLKEFVDLIDVVKVDFILSSKEKREKIAKLCKKHNIKMLAEKIENIEALNEAKKLGFHYFQGYYYSKPSIFLGKDIKIKNSSVFLILAELIKENSDLEKIENMIKRDVALTYKFLKFINSSYFDFIEEISSIKEAILLIGKEELMKWLSVLSFIELSSNSNDEHTYNTVIRAKYCEKLAELICYEKKEEAFLVGLFSNLHLMMEKDLKILLEDLPINNNIKEALLGKNCILKNILDLVLAYEKVEEEKIIKLCALLGVDEGKLWDLYFHSLEWSKKITH
ncbi:EAL and HDOD domain-containing protein [Caproiciproducens sp. MSJ-32]|uniref:EAL and HDOD domain-containing protein n=1 Tax=Caproiciproducens sp. MSJ-32 TaxID=2841527 RepID=UPI001C1101D6|nr:HDOD domain-containing protein [Caproiciproducens sp. MSJ-32]MBU5453885.1 EAL domain-containing protein [Caproiciproducens sp. MSJ-32]